MDLARQHYLARRAFVCGGKTWLASYDVAIKMWREEGMAIIWRYKFENKGGKSSTCRLNYSTCRLAPAILLATCCLAPAALVGVAVCGVRCPAKTMTMVAAAAAAP